MLNDICIFDFETTGISPKTERVIEMAALRIRDGVEIAPFTTLVKQTVLIHPKAQEAHGIDASQLVNAMDEDLAFKILRNIMGDSVLVAHNYIFDSGFLHDAMQRIGGKTFHNSFLDTLTIARDRYVYPHKLEELCPRLGIELTGAHRAMNDVRGTAALLQRMHEEKPVDEWLNKLGYMKKFGAPKWLPTNAESFPIDLRYAN
jgi:DNA polymerase-3 subunit epsilon/DNA polymerase-3 subunit alpha (Gram-positive type)